MDLAEGTIRESGVVFHKIGISEEDNDSGYNGWKMRTLSKLSDELLSPPNRSCLARVLGLSS